MWGIGESKAAPGLDPLSSKARKKKNFFDGLSNSGPPFDYIVKTGQLARPKTKKELNH